MTNKIQGIFVKFPFLLLPVFLILLMTGIICLFYVTDTGEKLYIIPAVVCFIGCIIISRLIDKSKKKKEKKEPDKQIDEHLYY
jgi:hypothetical protein